MSDILKRAITGAVFVAVLVLSIVFGGVYFHFVFALIAIVALNEFYSLFKKAAIRPNISQGLIFGTLFYFVGTWVLISDFWYPIMIGGLVLGTPIVAFGELFRKKKTPFENVGVTILGWLYIILPLVILNHLMWDIESSDWQNYIPVLAIFIFVWTSDTFAYLVGRKLGKRKLFERISPKKSWEGFIGGMIFTALAGAIFAYVIQEDYFDYILLGVLISVFGTLGDLVESMLKRSLKIKDSGNILPGHGGILDRIDAAIFVIPIAYFYFQFVID